MTQSSVHTTGRCPVMIIDDDALSCQMIADLLTAAGHTVMTLSSPIGASRELMAMGAHVVVLDVMMPSIRGDKLASLLRKNPRLSQLGIVLVSGLEPSELNDISGELSGAQVVAKGSLDVQLSAAVLKACRRCRD